MSDIQRFDIPTKATIIDTFRAFRAYVERVSAAKGETLDPEWYRDSPEEAPTLYQDQPEVLAALRKQEASPNEACPQAERPQP